MFDKNVFKKADPVADAIKAIAEQDYKLKLEALKGDQEKLDKNKNNKLDADDFKILRGEKKSVKEGWDDMMKASKERREAKPSGDSGVKKGSRYGGSKQKDKPEHDEDKKKVEEATMQPKGPARSDVPAYMRRNQKPLTLADIRKRSTEKKSKTDNAVKEEFDLESIDPALIEEFMQTEAFEQLDELSKKTLRSYFYKSHDDSVQRYKDVTASKKAGDKDGVKKNTLKWQKRIKGQYDANKRIMPDEHARQQKHLSKEEVEQLDEISKKVLKSYLRKSEKSEIAAKNDAQSPYESVKSKEKAKHKAERRSIGQWRAKKHLTKEEVEQIDELSKKTLASYAKKATDDVSYHSFSAGTRSPKDPGRLEDDKKAMKRQAGVGKAVDRLAKEEVDQIDERKLTSSETAEKERLAKGMKKGLAGFKSRYGSRAKEVLYATATKKAKE